MENENSSRTSTETLNNKIKDVMVQPSQIQDLDKQFSGKDMTYEKIILKM